MENTNRYFGKFGGRFIPEVLRPAFIQLEEAWERARDDKNFWNELAEIGKNYVGRPTPLYRAKNLEKLFNTPVKIYLKLEGHAHTGAHKINNALGQALLAKRMGKTKIIAETGAGQHGLACSAAAAKFGLDCEIFMGEIDMSRQRPNVLAMEMYGARVRAVTEGSRTLTDAVNAAMKNWTECCDTTHLVIGSALGPHPYPTIVKAFQSVIGKEIHEEILRVEKKLPNKIFACVGGGSNAIGCFSEFLDEKEIELVAVEAGGKGFEEGSNAIRIGKSAKIGIVQGYKSYFLQNDFGSLLPTHSISAGLDYAGIGPELAYLSSINRIKFCSANDSEALSAVGITAKEEGILIALESAHAMAALIRELSLAKNSENLKNYETDSIWVVNISGRGDKDLFITAPHFNKTSWQNFLEEEVNRLKEQN